MSGTEPLRQVQVTVLELKRSAVTADDGTFAIPSVPAGKYTLRVAAVLPPYQRLDIRRDKSWAFEHWKMTFHVEGLNMTNHDNPQVIGSAIDFTRNILVPEFGKGLPILPTAGLVFEF